MIDEKEVKQATEKLRDVFRDLDVDPVADIDAITRYNEKGELTDYGSFMLYAECSNVFRHGVRLHKQLLKHHDAILDHLILSDKDDSDDRAIIVAEMRSDLTQMIEWLTNQATLSEGVCKKILVKMHLFSEAMKQKIMGMIDD